MYKLFLAIRYLLKRPIALLPMIGIALCVWMVLVVSSVMTGFLDLVESSARGMLGDVIVDVGTPGGLAHYDELIAEVEAIPDVQAATPVIYAYGLLRVDEDFTQFARLVGMRLPEATEVTTFAQGLWPQGLQENPAFAVSPDRVGALERRTESILPDMQAIEQELQQLQELLYAEMEKPPAEQDPDRQRRIQLAIDRGRKQLNLYERLYVYDPQLPGVMLGVDIGGTTTRDPDTGEITRYIQPGQRVTLVMLPIGRGRISQTALEPISKPFTVVGDARMGIYQVDSMHVYVDFDTLQNLVDMAPRTDLDTGRIDPARASQLLVKVHPPTSERKLQRVADEVRAAWERLAGRHVQDLGGTMVDVRTWREKQAMFIGPIEKQRVLVIVMFGVVSLVAVVLVFAIFYMLVVQKTKDIGILKSIGGSSWGVGAIFLIYGMAIGLVGSVLGSVGGYLFVRNINPIHDWVANVFDYRVFDKRAYLFDQIPSSVDFADLVTVVVAAVLAGLVGSLLPAWRAARMQPVEALRYE